MTRQDLLLAVLQRLLIYGPGEVPAPEDTEKVDRHVDPQLKQLARRGIVYVQDTDDIEDDYEDPLVTIIANACAPAYGQARNPTSVLEAENLLREMQSGDGAGAGTTKSLYY